MSTVSNIKTFLHRFFCLHDDNSRGFDRDGKPWRKWECKKCGRTYELQCSTYVDKHGSIRPNLTPNTWERLKPSAELTRHIYENNKRANERAVERRSARTRGPASSRRSNKSNDSTLDIIVGASILGSLIDD